jgi:hypothetical protein
MKRLKLKVLKMKAKELRIKSSSECREKLKRENRGLKEKRYTG